MKVRFLYIAYVAVFVVLCGAVGGLTGTAREADAAPWVSLGLAALQFLLIVGGGLGVYLLRRRTERRERTDAPDSIERLAATRAQAKAFIDLLVLSLLAGGVFVFFPIRTNPAWVLIGLVVVLVTDFWVRYALLTRTAAKVSV